MVISSEVNDTAGRYLLQIPPQKALLSDRHPAVSCLLFDSIIFGLLFHRCILLEHGVIYHFSSFLANCLIPYSSSSFQFCNNWGLISLMTKSYLTKLKTAKQALQVMSFFKLLLEDFYQDTQFFVSNQFLCQMLHNLCTVDDFPLH